MEAREDIDDLLRAYVYADEYLVKLMGYQSLKKQSEHIYVNFKIRIKQPGLYQTYLVNNMVDRVDRIYEILFYRIEQGNLKVSQLLFAELDCLPKSRIAVGEIYYFNALHFVKSVQEQLEKILTFYLQEQSDYERGINNIWSFKYNDEALIPRMKLFNHFEIYEDRDWTLWQDVLNATGQYYYSNKLNELIAVTEELRIEQARIIHYLKTKNYSFRPEMLDYMKALHPQLPDGFVEEQFRGLQTDTMPDTEKILEKVRSADLRNYLNWLLAGKRQNTIKNARIYAKSYEVSVEPESLQKGARRYLGT